MSGELTAGWRKVFWLEVAICVATAVTFLFAPETYLRDFAGFAAPDLRHHLQLLMSANILVCAYGWLYARMLLERPFPFRAFRFLQEAMAIGDVIILILSMVQVVMLEPHLGLWAGQVFMASLWLGIRVYWLVLTR